MKTRLPSKIIIFLSVGLLFFGCFPCDPPAKVEIGPLSDSALLMLPYVNGETYSFRHSNGFVVNFNAERLTHDEWTYCHHCCEYIYHYEVDNTVLATDYPIFNINFRIDNANEPNLYFQAIFSRARFYIPTFTDELDYFEFADSLKVNDTFYYNVFKLKSDAYGYPSQEIFVDSMYFSYEKGIIKILMSNDEDYTIFE